MRPVWRKYYSAFYTTNNSYLPCYVNKINVYNTVSLEDFIPYLDSVFKNLKAGLAVVSLNTEDNNYKEKLNLIKETYIEATVIESKSRENKKPVWFIIIPLH